MGNEEDIARAKQGVEVWNAWAQEELKKPKHQRAGVQGLTLRCWSTALDPGARWRAFGKRKSKITTG